MEEILVVAVCLVFNGLFAAYEMAFVSVPKAELRRLAKNGDLSAQRLFALREHPERTLSIIQIGITLVGAISAAVGGAGAVESIVPAMQTHWGWSENLAEFVAILAVVLPLSFLSVVIGELVPKSLALKNPLRITLSGSRALFFMDRILSPVVTLLEVSTRWILERFFRKSQASKLTVEATPLEIDALPHHHQQAVLNLAHIETRQLRDMLVPWKEVNFIQKGDSLSSVLQLVFASGHTRLPVTNEQDEVLGILHTKEFLAHRENGGEEWQSILRPVLRVRSTDSVLSTLRLMQTRRSHLAVVFGAQGERMGIVTLEDISEEIWGDIFDEDDDGRIKKIFAERSRRNIFHPE